jgi:hypothetical protein
VTSNDTSEPLDFERDLPTTPEDVAVLHRLRHASGRMDLAQYFEFLRSFPAPSRDDLRRRLGPREEPFEL